MIRLISNGAEETEKIGERLAAALGGTEVIALFGGLGMGKTAFTRGIARGLGVAEGVSSPTFARSGVMIIEWSENIEGALPDDAIRVTISRGENENQRIFEMEGVELP